MADFEAVLKVSDLPPGEVVKVEVGLVARASSAT